MEDECHLFEESPLQGPDPKATRELMDYILNKSQMISHFHQSFAEMGMNFKGFDVDRTELPRRSIWTSWDL